MPLNLPNLDDRTYKDLVEEARALIPAYAPEWTNHNPSDPGITLIELFAFLTEMLLYRINRVTNENQLAFLKLMKGPDWTPSSNEPLAEQLREQMRIAVLELREPNRAITCDDFERLAREADSAVARSRCLPRRNLESENILASSVENPGHISVVIVPNNAVAAPQPSPEMLQKVKDFLEPRRLLTTQVHVVGPRYFAFNMHLTLWLKPDAPEDKFLCNVSPTYIPDLNNQIIAAGLSQELQQKMGIALSPQTTVSILSGNEWLLNDKLSGLTYPVRYERDEINSIDRLNIYQDVIRLQTISALKNFFDPLKGGKDGNGWPFGRNVYVSEIYQLLDELPGIDYVFKTVDQAKKPLDEFTIKDPADASRLLRTQNELVAVELRPDELIDVQNMKFDLTIVSARGG